MGERAPPDVRAMFAAALQDHQAGRLREAKRLCRRALAVDPRHADSVFLLGVMAGQVGRHDRAVEMIGKAIAINAEVASYHYNLGNALQELGRLDEAVASYRRAIALRPDLPSAHSNLGVALQGQGRMEEAVACHRRAIELEPEFAEAHCNLGVALQALGRLDEAIACHRRAIALQPNFAEAHNNLGSALERAWRLDAAVVCYRRAIERRPDYPQAHANLGGALSKLRRLDEAIGCYRRAIGLRPDEAEMHSNLGNALADQGRLDEALASYGKAAALKPDFDFLRGRRLHTRMRMCDWDGIEGQIADLVRRIERGEKAAPPFAVLALVDSPEVHRRCTATFLHAANQDNAAPGLARLPRHDRIRLGYFSSDYHDHATAYLMAGLIERHDRARFEVVGFSFGPDEKGATGARVAAAFERFIDVRGRSDRDVALLARQIEIDVAVDLKGVTTGSRWNIFANRAAPIQVNYLGYPGTLGVDYIDYIIADQVVIPEGDFGYYSENVVYLPDTYQANDGNRVIAEKVFTRQELGLPADGFVFCCFNNNYKITPAVFAAWMRILGQVPGSVLWLLADNPWVARNLRREAAARGVDAGRLVFARRLPAAEHLARQRAADLFLDTLPYNAHTTASDALWAGLPVLTSIAASFPARVAASLLKAIELADLIATTPEAYERRAVELALNPDELAGVRARLARNRLRTPLFDTVRFARHIESAYSEMYERYQAGLDPAPIRVRPT